MENFTKKCKKFNKNKFFNNFSAKLTSKKQFDQLFSNFQDNLFDYLESSNIMKIILINKKI